MKMLLFPIFIACLLSSCGEGKNSSKQSSSPSTSSVPASSNISADAGLTPYTPGDSVPPMEVLGEGEFTIKGLADAFQQATGWPMPDYVTAKHGGYRVWNEKDFGGKNRAGYDGLFFVPPDKIIVLADAIEKAWRDKYGGNPEIEISRSVCEKTYGSADKTIHAGTIGLGLNEKYASYSLLKFTLSLDPVSGTLSLASYRGTEDTPAERE